MFMLSLYMIIAMPKHTNSCPKQVSNQYINLHI